MLVNVLQCHASTGNFHKCTHLLIKVKSSSPFNLHLRKILIFFYSYFCRTLLIQHGDIKSNPGPSKKHRPLTCCHWNVNRLNAHMMLKQPSTEAYNTDHKYDFICISENYLDSTVDADNKNVVHAAYRLS